IGYVIPFWRANFNTLSGGSSSSEIPTISSRSLYSFFSSSSSGISSRHGGHQVAQKFTSTTLPAQFSLFTGFPSRSWACSGGASSGFFTKRITGGFASPGRDGGAGAGGAGGNTRGGP